MWQFDECNDSKARNRLSFAAKVEAIHAYEKTPNYSKVSLMFKCSAKQIRTIIKNKEQILAQYASLPKNVSLMSEDDKPSARRRLQKISLLGIVMYEWFLRARRNPAICIISYKQLQNVALEVKRILNVENFFPNSAWLLHFRQKFNISDSDMKVQSNDPGPTELDLEEIVAHVVVREKKHNKYLEPTAYSFGNDDDGNDSPNGSPAFSITDTVESHDISNEGDEREPPSKYPKVEVEPIDIIEIESDDEDDDDSSGEMDRQVSIKTIDQALQHLKPLEDFALMKEDYRVIGLVSQLEIILNSSKNKYETG